MHTKTERKYSEILWLIFLCFRVIFMFQLFCSHRFSNMSLCYYYNQKAIENITKTDGVSGLFFIPESHRTNRTTIWKNTWVSTHRFFNFQITFLEVLFCQVCYVPDIFWAITLHAVQDFSCSTQLSLGSKVTDLTWWVCKASFSHIAGFPSHLGRCNIATCGR